MKGRKVYIYTEYKTEHDLAEFHLSHSVARRRSGGGRMRRSRKNFFVPLSLLPSAHGGRRVRWGPEKEDLQKGEGR